MSDHGQPIEHLLQRAKRGEQQAVAELLDTYRNYLRLIARIHLDKTLRAKADPSDLVQETMLRAYPAFRDFRGTSEQEIVAWLRTVMAATAVDLVRRYRVTQRRNVRLERRLSDELDRSTDAMRRLVAPIKSPSQVVAGREAAVILADRLAQLPEAHREAIVLHYLEGLSIAAVADRIQRSPEATNSLLARALIKLRSLMRDVT